jgi:hypothetical protein
MAAGAAAAGAAGAAVGRAVAATVGAAGATAVARGTLFDEGDGVFFLAAFAFAVGAGVVAPAEATGVTSRATTTCVG